MPKYNEYRPNYKKLYAGIERFPEILKELRRNDRHEEYQEADRKRMQFFYDAATRTATFLPSREDSYERLMEDEHRQFPAAESTPEESLLRHVEYELIRRAVDALSEEERQFIRLRFWDEYSQSQMAKLLGVSQQAVSYRERRILAQLKKMIEI